MLNRLFVAAIAIFFWQKKTKKQNKKKNRNGETKYMSCMKVMEQLS